MAGHLVGAPRAARRRCARPAARGAALALRGSIGRAREATAEPQTAASWSALGITNVGAAPMKRA
eukprot:7000015-Pyramimonas_sp.AAC.1